MKHLNPAIKRSLLTDACNVRTSGVNPVTLLAAYYASRIVPFDTGGAEDPLSFNNEWESAMPKVKEFLNDLNTCCVFGIERAMYYTRRIFEYRVMHSTRPLISLYNDPEMYMPFFNEASNYNGVTITDEHKFTVIRLVSEAMLAFRGKMFTRNGFVSSEAIYNVYNGSLPDNESRVITKYYRETGISIIRKLIKILVWSNGGDERLGDMYRPFVKSMFDHVEKGCIVDNGMYEFIKNNRLTVVLEKAVDSNVSNIIKG